jgi:hypothetical protein
MAQDHTPTPKVVADPGERVDPPERNVSPPYLRRAQKLGHSIAVTLSAHGADRFDIEPQTPLSVDVREDAIVIRPAEMEDRER